MMYKDRDWKEISLIDFGGAENIKSWVKIYSDDTTLDKEKVHKNDSFCILINALTEIV